MFYVLILCKYSCFFFFLQKYVLNDMAADKLNIWAKRILFIREQTSHVLEKERDQSYNSYVHVIHTSKIRAHRQGTDEDTNA